MFDGRRMVLMGAALGHFVNDANSVAFPMLIIYYHKMGIPLSYLGLMALLYGSVSALSAERVGRFADMSERKGRVMALGIAFLGVAMLIFGAVFTLPSLALPLLASAAVVLGLGLSFYHPVGASIVASVTKRSSTSFHLGVNGSFGSLGRALSPAIVALCVEYLGGGLGLSVEAAATLMACLAMVALTGSAAGRPAARADQKKQPLGRYRRFIASLMLILFLRSVFAGAVVNYLPTYFDQYFGQLVWAVVMVMYLSPVVGQPVLGRLTDRLGGRKVIFLTSVASVTAFAFFLLLQHSPVLQMVSMAVFSFVTFSGFPLMMGYTSQMLPEGILARVNGMVWAFGTTIGSGVGGALGGFVGSYFGLGNIFLVAWVIGMVSVAFLPLMPKTVQAT
ncbi:MAG: MFS transporter [Nitrososphaerota archaeon]|nr:MFS transporter [Nitrososphaerota archaeon]MDG6939044.1 MFS transporter [Nitrososphaerota archaeon]